MSGLTSKLSAMLLSTGLVLAPAEAAELITGLKHNPFQRPALVTSALTLSEAEKPPIEGKKPEVIELRATMVSAHQPLAVVGKEIITIGGEVSGYKLLKIEEGSALFLVNGEQIRLVVGGNTAEAKNE